ncbi:MAG TPA: succinate dehydrogenase assembly factor 2 [Gammaproteobacteria bacterium]
MCSDLARLAWRCRRGMLELDLLLQGFLEHGYDELGKAQRMRFVQLLELNDQQLLDYLMEREIPKERDDVELISKIRHAARP